MTAATGQAIQAALTEAVRVGDWGQARAIARRALEDPDADKAVVQALLGQLAEKVEQAAEARGHYTRARELGSRDPDVAARLAALTRADDPEGAAELLAEATTHPDAPSWAFALLAAIAAEDLADPRWALSALSRAEGGMPESARLVLMARAAADAGDAAAADEAARGLVALAADGALDPATLYAAVEKLLIMDPAPPSAATDHLVDRLATFGAPTRALALLRSRRALGLRDPARALELARVAAAERTDGPLELFVAELLAALGELELAQAGFERAVAAGVTVPTDTWLALADGLRQRERLDEAAKIARRATEERPDHAGAWVELARIEADLGREREGERAFAEAMMLDPEIDREAGRIHGLARELIGGLPDALGTWGLTMTGLARVRFGHNAVVVEVDSTGPATSAGAPGESGRHFVKAFLPGLRHPDHVAATTELLARLAALEHRRIAVPTPLRREDGALTAQLAGCETFVMGAAPGAGLRRTLADPRRLVTVAHAEGLGGALAALQDAFGQVARAGGWSAPSSTGMAAGLAGFTTPGVTTRWRERVLRAGLGHAFPSLIDEASALLERLEGPAVAAVKPLAKGLVHGDFGWHNVLWVGTRPVAVIDFDYAANDLPMGDLVNAILRTAFDWKLLLTRRDPAARLDIAQGVVRGYRQAGGAIDMEPEAFEALLAAVRVEYYTSMALMGLTSADPRSPRSYPRAADTLRVLVGQLAWLENNRGLGAQMLAR